MRSRTYGCVLKKLDELSNMEQYIALVAVVVRDYDEAKDYYTSVLGFSIVEDTEQENGKRWIVLSPPGSSKTGIILQKALTDEQFLRVGNQTGGRVFLFLHTDDFSRDFSEYQKRGVTFLETPREEGYGTVVKFEDLYKNRWDLLQLKKAYV